MADKSRRNRHERDAWVRQARNDGYRSRAVYKLQEIDQRDQLFKPGMMVLDIGCAPGSWCQYASGRVGSNGVVVGVDIEQVEGIPGASLICGDICDLSVRQQCREALGGSCALVICDIAPHITGVAASDQAKMEELLHTSLELTEEVLGPAGQALYKVFSGQAEASFRSALKKRFATVKTRKPSASRQRSPEFYLLCQGYKGADTGGAVV